MSGKYRQQLFYAIDLYNIGMTSVPSGKTLRLMIDHERNIAHFLPPLGKYVPTLQKYGFTYTNQYEAARKECDGGLELELLTSNLIEEIGLTRCNAGESERIDEYWTDEE